MLSARTAFLIPILAYHSVSDEYRDGTLRWSVSPAHFDEQMALLKERGCTSLTVGAYVAARRGMATLPARPVLITFDDGFADLGTAALPVLRRYGLTATAYVITGRVGHVAPHGDPVLGWAELAELRGSGIEIGSHSHSHRELDCLGRAEVRREVARSKLLLEEGLAGRVSSFAYPYGYSSPSLRREVRAAGYTSACGVKNALSHERDDLFSLARVLVQRDTSVADIDAWLEGRGAPRAWPGERLQTRGWRLFRRARRLVDRPWPRSARAHGAGPATPRAGRSRS